MKEIFVEETASTNAALAAMADDGTDIILYTHRQTAGRGQRGNSWEAEPGKNLTFSLRLHPRLRPAQQFAVSEAVALGVAETLGEMLPSLSISVKWPNDIYADDRKICGILIEHSLSGSSIERSIAGIGVNVNQAAFCSDAPNPVSLTQLTGDAYPLEPLMRRISDRIMRNLAAAETEPEKIHHRYNSLLWRRRGEWPWRDKTTGELFTAAVETVAPDGHLLLRTSDGALRSFAFKEVAPIINGCRELKC